MSAMRTPPMGPENGRPESCVEMDAALIASVSYEASGCSAMTVSTIWTSLRRPLVKVGRSGRSISRQARIASGEGRPSAEAILACRLIDRPLRPTFTKGLRDEGQIVVTVMALHPDDSYDTLAINAASISTQLSGLPFSGPIGGVRIALIDGQWVCLLY